MTKVTKTTDTAGVEHWLDSLDPATASARDAVHMRRIAAARESVDRANQDLVDAVRAARDAGDTWSMIGIALGTTRQNAFQRFGRGDAAGENG